MAQLERSYRLTAANHAGVSCGDDGLFVGETALLERSRERDCLNEWRPRALVARLALGALLLVLSTMAVSPARAAGRLLPCRNAAHFVEAATEDLRRSHREITDTGRKLDRIASGPRDRCLSVLAPLLIRLLRNEDNLVRLYAAEGLGYIGPPAKSAVPALKLALTVNKCVCVGEDCQDDPPSSTLQIELALMSITGSPENPFSATEALCHPDTASGAAIAVQPAPASPKPPYPVLTTRSGPCGNPARTVEALIGDLRQPHFEDVFRAGTRLENYVSETPDRCMRPLLSPLVEALRDKDDLIRLYAAEALGDIGPPAHIAVPSLELALKLDKCVCDGSDCAKGSWSSTLAIEFAMMEITGSEGDPKLYQCDYSGSVPMKPAEPAPS